MSSISKSAEHSGSLSRVWPVALALLVGLGAGVGVRDQFASSASPLPTQSASPPHQEHPEPIAATAEDLRDISIRIAATVAASVVRLDIQRDAGQWADRNLAASESIYQLPTTEQGTAIILSADGHLLTNYHLVQSARHIVANHERLDQQAATIVGVDPISDLAVLHVKASGLLQPVVWTQRSSSTVGEFVWAIGYPFGFPRSVSFGVLGAIDDRPVERLRLPFGCLQTDAAVNPGSSGGPLVDATGCVIGINTAIVGSSFQGIGFAIPAQVARDVVAKLLASHSVTRGWLGGTFADEVSAEPLDLDVQNPVPANAELPSNNTAGVRWVRVTGFVDKPGTASPLRAAGVLPGDAILKWNDRTVESAWELERYAAAAKPGQVVHLQLRRGEQVLMVEVVVGDSR